MWVYFGEVLLEQDRSNEVWECSITRGYSLVLKRITKVYMQGNGSVQKVTRWKRQKMKKALRETQTLRAGCSKAERKISFPPHTPFPGGAGRLKFNQLEMVTTFTYRPSLVKIDARNSSYRGNRPTHKHSHKPTDRTDYNTLRR